MQVKYLKNYVLLSLQEEGVRHEEGNSQITEDKMLVAEFLRRSENTNELLGKNYKIRGRKTFSLTDSMQNFYRKFCLEFSDIKISFTAFCRGRPYNVKLRDTYAYASVTLTCP